MKRLAITVIWAVLVSFSIPAAAQKSQEDTLCQVAAKPCLKKVEILQKRIRQLDEEIRKGNSRYSAEELKKVEKILNEALEQLEKSGR
jgi:hypothetical protein